MKYKKFYFGKLSPKILENLDEEQYSSKHCIIQSVDG